MVGFCQYVGLFDRSMNSEQEKTILIIDDTPMNLGVMTDTLEDYGFEIITALDGQEGLERARRVQPDLILLDVLMPDLNGFEVCRQLKADQTTREIPVIFMTSLVEIEHKVQGFTAGGVDYITKPFAETEVLARVTTHLRLSDLTQKLQQANQELLRLNTGLEEIVAERTAKLGQSEKRFRRVVTSISDYIYMTEMTEQGQYINRYLSPNFETLTGYSLSIVMDDWHFWSVSIIHPDDKATAAEQVMRLAQGQNCETEYRLVRADDRIIWVRDSARVEHMGGSRIIYGVVSDITERKRMEQEKDELLATVRQSHQSLRDMSARLAETQELERKRLARELHDRVGQNLSTMGFILNIVRDEISQLLPDTERDTFLTRVDNVLDLTSQTTDHLRNVMAELRPSVLDDYGLSAALRWYGERLSEQIGIPVVVQGDELSTRLPVPVENVLFRIAQEALTNILKHAQATQITLTLTVTEEILLLITDNGVGFDPVQPSAPGSERGWGLFYMAERAISVGGQCQIESSPGKGTQVAVRIKRD